MPSWEVAARIGENIRRERCRAGVTQEELARLAGLHRTAIGLMENGRRIPRADTLIQVAGALSISPALFFEGVSWSPTTSPAPATLGGRFRLVPAEDDDGR